MASGLESELRAVIVVHRPKRTHHREVIRTFADMLKPIADHQPALAVAAIAGLQRHDRLAIAVTRIGAHDVLLDLGRIEHVLVRRVGNRFAGVFVQLRLHVETLDMTQSAAEKNPDDRFGFGREMGRGQPTLPGARCAKPSLNRREDNAKPVKPMPVSKRKERRVTPGHWEG